MNNLNVANLFVSQKIDGVSTVCTYENGQLISMISRGDGYDSTDWTDKIEHINIPKTISFTDKLIIRGELTLTNTDHITLGFKTRRSGVAGIMNSKEIEPHKLSCVHAYFYEVLSHKWFIDKQFEFLQSQTFNTPEFKILSI